MCAKPGSSMSNSAKDMYKRYMARYALSHKFLVLDKLRAKKIQMRPGFH